MILEDITDSSNIHKSCYGYCNTILYIEHELSVAASQ